MLYEHAGQKVCSLMVSIVVTDGRSRSFQTLNLELLKTKQDNFVLISIALCADSIANYACLDLILCLKNM